MLFLSINFWEKLAQWDQSLFIKINSDWSNPVFDAVMPFLRNSLNWVPLYLFLLVFVLVNFKVKGLWWVVFFISTVALADMTGTYVFKHSFERLRPCNDPGFYTHVRLLLKQCAGGYSFTSNHAANHFGMATFIFLTFRHLFKNWMLLVFLWAGSIGYAQIYVGVHYPTDIAGGTILGIIFGSTTAFLFNKYFAFTLPDKKAS
jgi:membrane-associated phospholipid phosphatase